MSDLTCTEYSEKAIVVRGESTKKYKDELTQLGGKYNSALRGGAGWIFSKKSEVKVNHFISNKGHEKVKTKTESKTNDDGNFTDLLNDIKERFDSIDISYRLKFISDVVKLLSKPVENLKPLKPLKPIENVVKQKDNIVIEDEEDEDNEDDDDEHIKPTPHKRLL
jgi:hypothetical protein